MMQICQKCVLDDKFPRINFDSKGICNYCRSSKKADVQKALKKKYENRLIELISQNRGKSNYDCLVAFSGGKDSTYTLHLIKNKYKLNILAFSFDNWFQSKGAYNNICNVIKKLDIDHLIVMPKFETFKKIMHTAISHELYSPKTLERASTVCTTCLALIRFTGFKIAIEKNIPFVVFGLSPGQAPVVTSVFKTSSEMIRKMQNAIFKPLFNHLGNIINPYFLNESHFNKKNSFPYSINPLAFSDYNEDEMISIVQNFGWIKPDDTDANSTNCLLNAFANQLHIEKYGYNPYAFEISELVRNGSLSREEGIKRLKEPPSQEQIDRVKKKLRL